MTRKTVWVVNKETILYSAWYIVYAKIFFFFFAGGGNAAAAAARLQPPFQTEIKKTEILWTLWYYMFHVIYIL
jgi:hypothetical protein